MFIVCMYTININILYSTLYIAYMVIYFVTYYAYIYIIYMLTSSNKA